MAKPTTFTPWTTDETTLLHSLKNAGKKYSEIGDILNKNFGLRKYSTDCLETKWKRTDWASFGKQKETKEKLIEELSDLESEKRKVIDRTLENNERLTRREQARTHVIIDNILSSIYRLPKPKSSDITYKPRHKHQYTAEHLGIMLSDLHIGAAYTLDDTGGLSEYNLDIFKQRLERMKNAVIGIVERHRLMYDIPELHIFCLGDIVAGAIGAGHWNDSYIELAITDQLIEGVQALHNMLATWSQMFEKVTFYGIYGNHGRCVPITTKALTPSGYKGYNELKVGDLIGTLNIEKNQFEFQPIKDITYIPNEKEIYKYKSSVFNLEATLDHDLVVETANKKIRKRKFSEVATPNNRIKIPITRKSGCAEYDIEDDELRLLGLIMSDGSYQPSVVKIYQSKPNSVKAIYNFLTAQDIPFSESIRDRNVKEICGKKLKSQHSEHSFNLLTSDTKKRIMKLLPNRESIPEWMYKLSDRQVEVLLHWIALGDGTFRKEKKRKDGYTQHGGLDVIWGKKHFLEQLAGLLVSHGIPANLEKHKSNSAKKDNYYLQIRKTKNYSITTKNIQKISYNKSVWCPTVDNGTFFALNEYGDAFITGNCSKSGIGKAYDNWDRVCYEIIKIALSNYNNIVWNIPKAWYLNPTVQGHSFYLCHGDGIKSSMGIPYYGVERAEAKISGMMEQQLDYVLMGHFHNPAEIQTNTSRVLINGNWMAGDMYSLKDLSKNSTPEQKIFGIHKKKGLTWTYNINLLED